MKLTASYTPKSISVDFSTNSVSVSTGNPIAREYIERDPYTGEYTVTPSAETQVLETKNCRMVDNVVINPIPNNYGLITTDGSVITVS